WHGAARRPHPRAGAAGNGHPLDELGRPPRGHPARLYRVHRRPAHGLLTVQRSRKEGGRRVPGYHRHTYYSDMVNRETCLYRFYDSAGRLLYVGITMDLSRRLAKHRQRDWWPDVAEADYEYFPGR